MSNGVLSHRKRAAFSVSKEFPFNEEIYGLPSHFLLVQDLLFALYGALSDATSQEVSR